MRETLSPSCRDSENPPAPFDIGTAGAGGGSATAEGASVTGPAADGRLTVFVLAVAAGSAVLGAAVDIVAEVASLDASTVTRAGGVTVACRTGMAVARSQSITRRNGL